MPCGKALSQDAVDIIRYMHEVHKLSFSKIGELIGRPKGYIGRILDKCDPITGERILAKKGRRPKSETDDNARIREMALNHPYIGFDGLTKMYNDTVSDPAKKLSKSSVHRRLRAIGVHLVKIPATTPELDAVKAFPKSKHVFKFEPIPEKKKRRPKKKKVEETVEVVSQQAEFEGTVINMPEALPVTSEQLAFMFPSSCMMSTDGSTLTQIGDQIQIIMYPPGQTAIQLQ